MSEICIVGGGLTGIMMAVALSHSGASEVTLVRLAPPSVKSHKSDNRTTTIHTAGKSMLDILDVWRNIKTPPTPINRIMVAGGATGLTHRQKDFELDFYDPQHPMAYVVDNESLLNALHDVCTKLPINIIQPANIIGIETVDSKARLICAERALPDFDLVIGCDGARSQLRNYSKLRHFKAPHQQTAIVATLALECDHKNTAFQKFLPGGPIALMPSSDRLMSLVWTMQKNDAKDILACNKKDFDVECNAAFGSHLGYMRVVGACHEWPLQPSWMPKLGTHNLLFAGDAAHNLHPLAGQGYNMALADAAVLADCIKAVHHRGLTAGHLSVRQNYQIGRQIEIAAMTAMTSGLNMIMSYTPSKVAKLAGVGMSLVNASPLKKIFQSIASGGMLSQANLLKGRLPD